MKKLILLALFSITTAAFCQNTPASNPFHGAITVAGGAPAGSFAIDANGNATVTISNTVDSGLTVGNANGNILIGSNTGVVNSFAPELVGNARGTNQAGLKIFANIAPGFDTGTIPLFYMRSTVNLGTVSTRPLLGLYNNATNVMTVNADGSTVIPQLKSTTGTRYVCVDTTGKLISSTTACSGT